MIMPKQKQVVKIAASLSADPVVSLGRRMVELNKLGEEEELKSRRLRDAGDESAARDASRVRGELFCREWDLAAAAVSLPAASFEAAILQSMLAGCMVDIALSSTKTDSTDQQLKLADRALYSIRIFLERVSGLQAEKLLDGHYVNDHLNPFAATERGAGADRLAGSTAAGA
jgi:hypothetical protein